MRNLTMLLEKREQEGNLRALLNVENLIDFASNDYLGLAKQLATYNSAGSTGARLLTGNNREAEDLEEKIAYFHKREAALLFNCGYMANIGLLSSLAREGDTILYDTQVHASMRDGIRLSKASAYPFYHQDIDHLEKRLKNTKGQCYVCICSVYSMSGRIAPIETMLNLCKKYDAELIVDEAHAIGVLGHQGLGLGEQAFAQVVTFGKGLGAHGAAVLGSCVLKKYLVNFARSFIYTTALPKSVYASISQAYDLFPNMDKERAMLRCYSNYLGCASHIYFHPMPGSSRAKLLSRRLAQAGFDVRPILSPSVKRGREGLRICLHAFNTQKQVEDLCRHLS